MIRRAPPRRRRRAAGLLARAGLLACAGVALLPVGAAGQLEALIPERRAAYRSAVLAYESAIEAQRAIQSRWEQALAAHEEARRSGSEAEYDAAQARARRASLELQEAQRRVQEAEEALGAARRGLMEVLDERRRRLEEQLESDPPASTREGLLALIEDLQNQYRELEESRHDDELQATLVFQPSIQYSPRDGPDELRVKADLAERHAREADSTIARIDRDLERLRGRLRLDRIHSDARASRRRFDDAQPPVGAAGSRNRDLDRLMPDDSTGVSIHRLPLPQQIEALEGWKEQLVHYRDEMLGRAERFRERLRRIT